MKLSKSITISIIAHVLLIVLLALNFHFSKIKPKSSGPVRQMNATAVNAASVKSLLKNIKQKDINKKNKEIERLRKIQKQKDSERKKKLENQKKAEEKKRKKQAAEVIRKENEKKKKKAADDKKKRIADEKARKKKIASEKRKKEKQRKAAEAEKKRKAKEKAAADKKRKEAEEKAAIEREMEMQMAAEAEALNAAHMQQVMTEVDKYRLLIENKIQRNWIAPENKGFCNFRMKLAPGGLVLNVTSVSGDQLHCETGQRAIYKSEPLPVSNDPDVFAELRDMYFQLKDSEGE